MWLNDECVVKPGKSDEEFVVKMHDDARATRLMGHEGLYVPLYGVQCVGFQTPEGLAPDLHDYMLAEDVFNVAESKLTGLGFVRIDDDDEFAGHTYYEGYFHGMATPHPILSLDPRTGHDMEKLAAPLRIRAFCEALRRINRAALSNIAAAAAFDSLVHRFIEEERAFGDITFQIHFGDGLRDRNLKWHLDFANSMLHMALGLHGNRIVHTSLRKATVAEQVAAAAGARHRPTINELRNHKFMKDERSRAQGAEIHRQIDGKGCCGATTPSVKSFEQRPGDTYIATPANFLHSIEYPKASWEDRIIVLQLRLLMTMRDNHDPQVEWGAEAVALAVAAHGLRMPSLLEVQHIVREFQAGVEEL